MMLDNILADRMSWRSPRKSYKGAIIKLIAVQKSRRRNRKGRTSYIYRVGDRIYYNQSKGGVIFAPIAPDDIGMQRYLDVFIERPDLPEYREWRQRNDYELV